MDLGDSYFERVYRRYQEEDWQSFQEGCQFILDKTKNRILEALEKSNTYCTLNLESPIKGIAALL